jgi:nanoRNase/pAp phosphatase (c-di-AMP/oligoRNAs hydrolase)
MSYLVIYHGNCFDGFTAAWVVNGYLEEIDEKGEFYPATYGSYPPDVKGKNVYIVDFSYPRNVLMKMYDDAKNLLVLDHHKTAQDNLEGLDFCIFDMERSGAGIAWDYFFNFTPRPWLVNTIEDRDLWKFNFPYTKEIMAYIASSPFTFESWDDLYDMGYDATAKLGEGILKYIKQYGEKACQFAKDRYIGNYKVPTINISYQNCSDHLDLLASKNPNAPFVASFFLDNENKWRFSLRSKGDFDVSAIAKQYGGGGHKNAAGFIIDDLEIIK